MFIIKCCQRVIHVHTIQKHENGIITLGFNLVDCIVSLFRTQYWANSLYHIRVELAVAWVFNVIFSNISDIIFAVHFIKWGNRYYADDLFNIKQSLNVYLSLSLSLRNFCLLKYHRIGHEVWLILCPQQSCRWQSNLDTYSLYFCNSIINFSNIRITNFTLIDIILTPDRCHMLITCLV
jgi:hypothetical protein